MVEKVPLVGAMTRSERWVLESRRCGADNTQVASVRVFACRTSAGTFLYRYGAPP
jgi:hypothetical protein